jgi:ribosomal protein S18 acetylase RimI-like enzyme
MLDFAKNHLAHPETNELYIYTDPEDGILVNKLIEGGFTPNSERTANESIFDLTRQALPDSPSLPKGFRLQSMAEDNDLAKRCEAFGRGFNHPEPLEWPSLKSYELLQTMPDYLPEQDIVVVSPDGQFVAFCLIWRDQPNKLASLEPVGTHPDFRRLGLAREAIYEAMRRVRDMGIETVIVGSDQTFYQKIGFKVCEHRIRFEIKAT